MLRIIFTFHLNDTFICNSFLLHLIFSLFDVVVAVFSSWLVFSFHLKLVYFSLIAHANQPKTLKTKKKLSQSNRSKHYWLNKFDDEFHIYHLSKMLLNIFGNFFSHIHMKNICVFMYIAPASCKHKHFVHFIHTFTTVKLLLL